MPALIGGSIKNEENVPTAQYKEKKRARLQEKAEKDSAQENEKGQKKTGPVNEADDP